MDRLEYRVCGMRGRPVYDRRETRRLQRVVVRRRAMKTGGARARNNARVAVDLDRGAHRALRALLDASRGYAAAAERLLVENPAGPGGREAHGLCASLDGTRVRGWGHS